MSLLKLKSRAVPPTTSCGVNPAHRMLILATFSKSSTDTEASRGRQNHLKYRFQIIDPNRQYLLPDHSPFPPNDNRIPVNDNAIPVNDNQFSANAHHVRENAVKQQCYPTLRRANPAKARRFMPLSPSTTIQHYAQDNANTLF